MSEARCVQKDNTDTMFKHWVDCNENRAWKFSFIISLLFLQFVIVTSEKGDEHRPQKFFTFRNHAISSAYIGHNKFVRTLRVLGTILDDKSAARHELLFINIHDIPEIFRYYRSFWRNL